MEKFSEAEVEPGERVLRETDSGVMVLERGCSIILALVEAFARGRSSPVVVLRALSSDRREPWRTEAWKRSLVRSSGSMVNQYGLEEEEEVRGRVPTRDLFVTVDHPESQVTAIETFIVYRVLARVSPHNTNHY